MALISKEVEVEVELDDFDDEDLLEECENRGLHLTGPQTQLIQQLYDAKTQGKQYEHILNDLFYNTIGRIA